MKLYLVLIGAEKHDPALLMPCGSYQFLYDPAGNRHILDGGALTPERFNEAAADLARRWPAATRFRVAPQTEEEEVPASRAQTLAWEEERAALRAQLAEKDRLLEAMMKTRRTKLEKPFQPTNQPITTPTP